MNAGLSAKNAALLLAAALLGITLQMTGGMYSAFGVGMLMIAFAIAVCGMFIPGKGLSPNPSRLYLLGLVFLQLFAMYFTPSDESLAIAKEPTRTFHAAAIIVAAMATILVAKGSRKIALAGFLLLLATAGAIGIWRIRTVSQPFIDVFFIQTEAADSLSHGQNPYAMTFKDIYGANAPYYAPGMIKDGRVQYGYPYMPLSLMVGSVSHWLFGDPRYAYLISIIATAIMIAMIRPDSLGMLMATLFLFTPSSFHIIQTSWVEPLSAMLLIATVLSAIRWPRLMPIAFGLLLASKQYLLAGIGLAPMFGRRDKWSVAGVATLTASIVTLPLVLWDIKAFLHSAVALHMTMPYRPDSLSLVAWWGFGQKGWAPPFWLSFAALGAAMTWSYLRIRKGTFGFLLSFAFCFFTFIILSKQAFLNYYYLIVAAACAAAALENYTSSSASADKTLSDHARILSAYSLHPVDDFGPACAARGGQPGLA
ncbi:MAG TPA: hypothetical protein VHD56_05490 [Tepidisphaeraceae bacterium]|nr:hypothetical protein [Tepidisphaeraceae bacterium]